MSSEMRELLLAGIDAMHGLKRMQDQMTPLIVEITRILEDGNVQLKALDLRDAIERRRRLDDNP